MKDVLYLIMFCMKLLIKINLVLIGIAMIYVIYQKGALSEYLISNFYVLLMLVLGEMLVLSSGD